MPAAHRLDVALQWQTEQREVAHEVEDLVANELVLEAKPVGIEHARFVQDDGVLQRAAERQASGTFWTLNALGFASSNASIMRWTLTVSSGRNRSASDHRESATVTGP